MADAAAGAPLTSVWKLPEARRGEARARRGDQTLARPATASWGGGEEGRKGGGFCLSILVHAMAAGGGREAYLKIRVTGSNGVSGVPDVGCAGTGSKP
jgi:hypothetical protein